MLSERLKKRLDKNRPMTSISLRIPVDMIDSLKEIAPHKGFTTYQTLLKAYISDGLRKDEAQLSTPSTRLFDVLRKHGVSDALLAEAARELESA